LRKDSGKENAIFKALGGCVFEQVDWQSFDIINFAAELHDICILRRDFSVLTIPRFQYCVSIRDEEVNG
jgi:hypothetical protein